MFLFRSLRNSFFTRSTLGLKNPKVFFSSIVQKLEVAPNHVVVHWKDKHKSRFHDIWLRDNCPCKICKDTSSHQKLKNVADLPNNLHAKTVTWDRGTTVDILWNDKHESSFPKEWLRAHCYERNSIQKKFKTQEPELWNGIKLKDRGVPTFEYSTIMESDRGVWEWLKVLNNWGLTLIKNVPTTLGQVEKVGNRISYIRETIYGKIFDVISVPDPENVAYSSLTLPPHQDLCYYEVPPGLQLLHCITFNTTGGESYFIDGFDVCKDFKVQSPTHFSTLKDLKITYHNLRDEYRMHYKRSVIHTDSDGSVIGIYYSPSFEGPLDIPFEDVPRFYSAYISFTNFLREPQRRFEFTLKPGDLVCFNNRRVLHGRNKFNPAVGPRHLQGTYIDLDEFANRFRVLQNKYEADNPNLAFKHSGNYSH